jgi:hypothetical protein
MGLPTAIAERAREPGWIESPRYTWAAFKTIVRVRAVNARVSGPLCICVRLCLCVCLSVCVPLCALTENDLY